MLLSDIDESYLLFEKIDNPLVKVNDNQLKNGALSDYVEDDDKIILNSNPVYKNIDNIDTVVSYFTELYREKQNNNNVNRYVDTIVNDSYTMLYIGSLTVVGLFVFYKASLKL